MLPPSVIRRRTLVLVLTLLVPLAFVFPVAPAEAAPTVDTAPAITPTAVEQLGTLSVSNGTWTTSGSVSYAFEWFLCENPDCSTETSISGATNATLAVPFTAAAKYIRAKVTATDDDGSSTAASNIVGPVRLAFEEPNENNVVLGDLASRSQRKQISVGGTAGNYTVIGTDSRTGELYSFLTDVDYASGAQQRESDERPTTGTYTSDDNASTLNVSTAPEITPISTRTGVLELFSDLGCAGTPVGGSGSNKKDGFETFCSVFGPEVWTVPFDADSGQALAFDYAAAASDNYEVYAFLVEVTCTDPADHTTCDRGGAGTAAALDTHSLILHRRGKNSDWTTATGAVPDSGRFRFRFVDGAYDATGGLALGTRFFIDPTSIVVGAAQTITFSQPGDAIRPADSDPDPTVSLTISNSSPLDITTSSLTTTQCTISETTVTLKANGTCTIRADAAGGTDSGTTYVAASTVIRSFEIRAEATAPENAGKPVITGTTETGATLTAQDGTWGDGGDAITATAYQWSSTTDGVTTDIAGATASTLSVPCSLVGATITVTVTKTNGVGSTSESSNATAALAEGDCTAAPAPTPAPDIAPVSDPGGGLPVAPPGTSTGSVGGVPTAPEPARPSGGAAEFRVGSVQTRIDVAVAGAGAVGGSNTNPVIRAVRDRVATVAGGGMRPGGIAEVWLPLPDGGSRQVALLPIAEDGTFDGALPFTGELDGQGPLPIGDRTIQLYGTDENGQLTVINFGVRIEQPGPLAPEPERAPGAPPTLAPGQSLATNAGLPTPVTVTPVPDARSTRIQGDGWIMDVDVPEGTVRDEAGAPIIEIVRGDESVVRGTGFMPGTRAYVWLMSEPTFLGEVTVAADGSFSGEVPVEGVELGQHTLQLSGVGTDGYVRAANLGVIVTGGLVPTRVDTGGGPVPLVPLPFAITVALAAVAIALSSRVRSIAAVTAATERAALRARRQRRLPAFDALTERLERLRRELR